MTPLQFCKDKNWTLQRFIRELSMVSQSHGTGPIYDNRVWQLRKGLKQPTSAEIRAADEVMGDEGVEFSTFRETANGSGH